MLKETIKADQFRYKGETSSGNLYSTLMIPGFRYTYFLRNANIYPKRSFRGIISRLFLYFHSYIYGFQIPPSTSIGKGLYIGHRGTIVINGNATIGEFCNLSPGVTIGQTNRGGNKGAPTIGSRVWIGTNAVIVGKILVGNNVLIAPNAFVNISVPSNSLVMGNPAFIIPKENATEGYIDYTTPEP